MRMTLNQDGTINAIGNVPSYPMIAPSFIVYSGHMRWQWDTVNDINQQSSWIELPLTEDPQEIDMP